MLFHRKRNSNLCGSLENEALTSSFGRECKCKSEDFFQEATFELRSREEEVCAHFFHDLFLSSEGKGCRFDQTLTMGHGLSHISWWVWSQNTKVGQVHEAVFSILSWFHLSEILWVWTSYPPSPLSYPASKRCVG